MEPTSLTALRSYATTQQALTPEKRGEHQGVSEIGQTLKEASAKLDTSNDSKEAPLVESAVKFAQVFKEAETTALEFSAGKADAQAVVEALATAEVALETAVTIRNRVVEAYQELLRMPV